METYSITKTLTHPEWGAPMEFHRIIRVEVDMSINETYISFASYYNETAFASGSSYMSITPIHLRDSMLRTEQELVQAVIDGADNVLSGGEIDINVLPGDVEDNPELP